MAKKNLTEFIISTEWDDKSLLGLKNKLKEQIEKGAVEGATEAGAAFDKEVKQWLKAIASAFGQLDKDSSKFAKDFQGAFDKLNTDDLKTVIEGFATIDFAKMTQALDTLSGTKISFDADGATINLNADDTIKEIQKQLTAIGKAFGSENLELNDKGLYEFKEGLEDVDKTTISFASDFQNAIKKIAEGQLSIHQTAESVNELSNSLSSLNKIVLDKNNSFFSAQGAENLKDFKEGVEDIIEVNVAKIKKSKSATKLTSYDDEIKALNTTRQDISVQLQELDKLGADNAEKAFIRTTEVYRTLFSLRAQLAKEIKKAQPNELALDKLLGKGSAQKIASNINAKLVIPNTASKVDKQISVYQNALEYINKIATGTEIASNKTEQFNKRLKQFETISEELGRLQQNTKGDWVDPQSSNSVVSIAEIQAKQATLQALAIDIQKLTKQGNQVADSALNKKINEAVKGDAISTLKNNLGYLLGSGDIQELTSQLSRLARVMEIIGKAFTTVDQTGLSPFASLLSNIYQVQNILSNGITLTINDAQAQEVTEKYKGELKANITPELTANRQEFENQLKRQLGGLKIKVEAEPEIAPPKKTIPQKGQENTPPSDGGANNRKPVTPFDKKQAAIKKANEETDLFYSRIRKIIEAKDGLGDKKYKQGLKYIDAARDPKTRNELSESLRKLATSFVRGTTENALLSDKQFSNNAKEAIAIINAFKALGLDEELSVKLEDLEKHEDFTLNLKSKDEDGKVSLAVMEEIAQFYNALDATYKTLVEEYGADIVTALNKAMKSRDFKSEGTTSKKIDFLKGKDLIKAKEKEEQLIYEALVETDKTDDQFLRSLTEQLKIKDGFSVLNSNKTNKGVKDAIIKALEGEKQLKDPFISAQQAQIDKLKAQQEELQKNSDYAAITAVDLDLDKLTPEQKSLREQVRETNKSLSDAKQHLKDLEAEVEEIDAITKKVSALDVTKIFDLSALTGIEDKAELDAVKSVLKKKSKTGTEVTNIEAIVSTLNGFKSGDFGSVAGKLEMKDSIASLLIQALTRSKGLNTAQRKETAKSWMEQHANIQKPPVSEPAPEPKVTEQSPIETETKKTIRELFSEIHNEYNEWTKEHWDKNTNDRVRNYDSEEEAKDAIQNMLSKFTNLLNAEDFSIELSEAFQNIVKRIAEKLTKALENPFGINGEESPASGQPAPLTPPGDPVPVTVTPQLSEGFVEDIQKALEEKSVSITVNPKVGEDFVEKIEAAIGDKTVKVKTDKGADGYDSNKHDFILAARYFLGEDSGLTTENLASLREFLAAGGRLDRHGSKQERDSASVFEKALKESQYYKSTEQGLGGKTSRDVLLELITERTELEQQSKEFDDVVERVKKSAKAISFEGAKKDIEKYKQALTETIEEYNKLESEGKSPILDNGMLATVVKLDKLVEVYHKLHSYDQNIAKNQGKEGVYDWKTDAYAEGSYMAKLFGGDKPRESELSRFLDSYEPTYHFGKNEDWTLDIKLPNGKSVFDYRDNKREQKQLEQDKEAIKFANEITEIILNPSNLKNFYENQLQSNQKNLGYWQNVLSGKEENKWNYSKDAIVGQIETIQSNIPFLQKKLQEINAELGLSNGASSTVVNPQLSGSFIEDAQKLLSGESIDIPVNPILKPNEEELVDFSGLAKVITDSIGDIPVNITVSEESKSRIVEQLNKLGEDTQIGNHIQSAIDGVDFSKINQEIENLSNKIIGGERDGKIPPREEKTPEIVFDIPWEDITKESHFDLGESISLGLTEDAANALEVVSEIEYTVEQISRMSFDNIMKLPDSLAKLRGWALKAQDKQMNQWQAGEYRALAQRLGKDSLPGKLSQISELDNSIHVQKQTLSEIGMKLATAETRYSKVSQRMDEYNEKYSAWEVKNARIRENVEREYGRYYDTEKVYEVIREAKKLKETLSEKESVTKAEGKELYEWLKAILNDFYAKDSVSWTEVRASDPESFIREYGGNLFEQMESNKRWAPKQFLPQIRDIVFHMVNELGMVNPEVLRSEHYDSRIRETEMNYADLMEEKNKNIEEYNSVTAEIEKLREHRRSVRQMLDNTRQQLTEIIGQYEVTTEAEEANNKPLEERLALLKNIVSEARIASKMDDRVARSGGEDEAAWQRMYDAENSWNNFGKIHLKYANGTEESYDIGEAHESGSIPEVASLLKSIDLRKKIVDITFEARDAQQELTNSIIEYLQASKQQDIVSDSPTVKVQETVSRYEELNNLVSEFNSLIQLEDVDLGEGKIQKGIKSLSGDELIERAEEIKIVAEEISEYFGGGGNLEFVEFDEETRQIIQISNQFSNLQQVVDVVLSQIEQLKDMRLMDGQLSFDLGQLENMMPSEKVVTIDYQMVSNTEIAEDSAETAKHEGLLASIQSLINSEKNSLSELVTYIRETVIQAIKEKDDAFEEEARIVDGVVEKEMISLSNLENSITGIIGSLDRVEERITTLPSVDVTMNVSGIDGIDESIAPALRGIKEAVNGLELAGFNTLAEILKKFNADKANQIQKVANAFLNLRTALNGMNLSDQSKSYLESLQELLKMEKPLADMALIISKSKKERDAIKEEVTGEKPIKEKTQTQKSNEAYGTVKESLKHILELTKQLPKADEERTKYLNKEIEKYQEIINKNKERIKQENLINEKSDVQVSIAEDKIAMQLELNKKSKKQFEFQELQKINLESLLGNGKGDALTAMPTKLHDEWDKALKVAYKYQKVLGNTVDIQRNIRRGNDGEYYESYVIKGKDGNQITRGRDGAYLLSNQKVTDKRTRATGKVKGMYSEMIENAKRINTLRDENADALLDERIRELNKAELKYLQTRNGRLNRRINGYGKDFLGEDQFKDLQDELKRVQGKDATENARIDYKKRQEELRKQIEAEEKAKKKQLAIDNAFWRSQEKQAKEQDKEREKAELASYDRLLAQEEEQLKLDASNKSEHSVNRQQDIIEKYKEMTEAYDQLWVSAANGQSNDFLATQLATVVKLREELHALIDEAVQYGAITKSDGDNLKAGADAYSAANKAQDAFDKVETDWEKSAQRQRSKESKKAQQEKEKEQRFDEKAAIQTPREIEEYYESLVKEEITKREKETLKAFKTLTNTEETYRKLTNKRDSEGLNENEAGKLRGLELEREKAVQRIQELLQSGVELTDKEVEAATQLAIKYNEVKDIIVEINATREKLLNDQVLLGFDKKEKADREADFEKGRKEGATFFQQEEQNEKDAEKARLAEIEAVEKAQRDRAKAFLKEQKEYEESTFTANQLKFYEELNHALTQYEEVMKRINSNNAFADDAEKAKRLEARILEIDEILKHSPFYNEEMSSKADARYEKIVNQTAEAERKRERPSEKETAEWFAAMEIAANNYKEALTQLISVEQQYNKVNPSSEQVDALNKAQVAAENAEEAYTKLIKKKDQFNSGLSETQQPELVGWERDITAKQKQEKGLLNVITKPLNLDEYSKKSESMIHDLEAMSKSVKYYRDFQQKIASFLNTKGAKTVSGGMTKEALLGMSPEELAKFVDEFENFKKKYNEFKESAKLDTNKNANMITVDKLRIKVAQTLSENTVMKSKSPELWKEFQRLQDQLKALADKGEGSKAVTNELASSFTRLTATMQETGATGLSFFDQMKDRIMGINKSFLGMYFSFYDIIRYIREFSSTVTEFDTALTEMRKVSDENTQSLKQYQGTTFELANSVGTTAIDLQKSTAEFMRLGQGLEEAATSASNATMLMNVSEFESISDATDSLIAMKAAYDDLDQVEIIDKLNNIGKNIA